MSLIVIILLVLAAWWLWSRHRKAQATAELKRGFYDIHETSTAHFPSMSLANTSMPGIPVFFDLARKDGPVWLSRPSEQFGRTASDDEWEPMDEETAARIEVAYQRFLVHPGDYHAQTKDWFRDQVYAYLEVRDGDLLANGRDSNSGDEPAAYPDDRGDGKR